MTGEERDGLWVQSNGNSRMEDKTGMDKKTVQ